MAKHVCERGYFGEIGILEQILRTATVTSISPSQLYPIGADDFRQALTEKPPATTFLDQARTRLARTHPAGSQVPLPASGQ